MAENTSTETRTTKLKLIAIGNSTGVILPREMLDRLHLDRGDELQALEIPDGVRLVPFDAEFARQLGIAEKVMREDRDVLRKLAE
jgi:putative addiction module antidote